MKKVEKKNSNISKFLLGVSAAVIGIATYTIIKNEKPVPNKEKLIVNKKPNNKLFI